MYGRSSVKRPTPKESYANAIAIAEYRKKDFVDRVERGESLARPLLDSSLISATKSSGMIDYTIKILECGDYTQVYYYNKMHSKKDQDLEIDLVDKKIDVNYLFKEENISRSSEKKYIEYKNINRSKFSMQRLVKTNEDVFKTFITLTFALNDRDVDIEYANKKFHIWRTKIKSIKKDFKYVCVPEYQKKRERKYGYRVIHYHLITNLDIQESPDIIIPQKNRKNCYDVKYWSYGFTSVYPLEDMNVVGYISKYMTKDIDNRLFGKRRYLYSQNLKKPIETVLNGEKDVELFILNMKICESDIVYNKTYYDLDNTPIVFIEYKKEMEVI